MPGTIPKIARIYFGMAILYLLAGIGVGMHMSISQDHSAMGAHAHINLLGWVTSAIFGAYYALNPGKAEGWLPWTQFCLYAAGLIVMLPSLYLMMTGRPEVEPVVAAGSMGVAAGVLLFAAVVFAGGRSQSANMRNTAIQPAE